MNIEIIPQQLEEILQERKLPLYPENISKLMKETIDCYLKSTNLIDAKDGGIRFSFLEITKESKVLTVSIINSRMCLEIIFDPFGAENEKKYSVYYLSSNGWVNPPAPDYRTKNLDDALNVFSFAYLLNCHILAKVGDI